MDRVQSLKTVLEGFLARKGAENGFALARLWKVWPEVVGPEVAELAKPIGHRKGRLILGAEDSIVLQEITYFGPQILERVNGFLGRKFFDKVSVELIRGRSPLDSIDVSPRFEPLPVPKPEHLGALIGAMDEDSPVARCYRAYVRMMQEK
ncbi:MAG: DUF721 domain-containing protein [Desulfovibrionales bacterium]